MRYHYTKPAIYASMYGQLYICDHPVYSKCTLFKMDNKGLAVIQQRFDSDGIIYNFISHIVDYGYNNDIYRRIWRCDFSGRIRRCNFMRVINNTYYSPFYQEKEVTNRSLRKLRLFSFTQNLQGVL